METFEEYLSKYAVRKRVDKYGGTPYFIYKKVKFLWFVWYVKVKESDDNPDWYACAISHEDAIQRVESWYRRKVRASKQTKLGKLEPLIDFRK